MAQAANSALFSARLRFVEGLPARAQELSSTAERLARDPNDLEAVAMLRRRLHALLASAQVFEERALSLAVQDLIARLDVAQRAERVFTTEEVDAVSLVVASLPTYVRPTHPPAAHSDVRELLKDSPRPSTPASRAPLEAADPAPTSSVVIEPEAEDEYSPPALSEPPPVHVQSKAELLAALMPGEAAAAEPAITPLPDFLAKRSEPPAADKVEADRTEKMRRVAALAADAAAPPEGDLSFGWSRADSFDAVAAGASRPVEPSEPPRAIADLPPALARSGVYFSMPAPANPSPTSRSSASITAFSSLPPTSTSTSSGAIPIVASPHAPQPAAANQPPAPPAPVASSGTAAVALQPAAADAPAPDVALHRTQTASGIFTTKSPEPPAPSPTPEASAEPARPDRQEPPVSASRPVPVPVPVPDTRQPLQEPSATAPEQAASPLSPIIDRVTDPSADPPVLLKQTVSGLLPLPRPKAATVLVVTEATRSSRLSEPYALGDIEVIQAHSADEAIRLLHVSTPDLVLISADLASSPEADLVRRVKTDPLSPVANVRVLLGEGATYDESFLEQCGADGIVREPLTAESLTPLVLDPQPTAAGGVREGTIDDIAGQIAEEIRRGIAESLRVGKNERVNVGDGSELMAAAWSAIGRVRSHLAEQNRGRLRVDDERRSPSLLPTSTSRSGMMAAVEVPEGAAGTSIHPSQLLAGCRVLVADDDPAVLWFFAGLLREASAQVLQAHNGREALELARRKQPHVIVSDILMPKLDGFGLCRELKRDALLAHVPVILLSWKDDLLQRMRDLDAGAAGYLRKEAGSQQILAQLADVLKPRTRLIAKLRAHSEAKGAIEELGAAQLLEIVAAERPDARLNVRDASNIFEVDIRSGRKLFVTRTAADGSFTRGDKALMQLLGITAGNYEVGYSSAQLRAVLNDPLDRALAVAGRRLAALLDAVSDARLLRVSLIAFDDEVLSSLLSTASPRLHEVVALFRTGNATAEAILGDGKFEPSELEAHLRTLARAAAINGVWAADGEDLALAAQRERETPQLALLSSSAPPKSGSGWSWPAAQRREIGDRVTPAIPLDPAMLDAARRTRSEPPKALAEDEAKPEAATADVTTAAGQQPTASVEPAARSESLSGLARVTADTDPGPEPEAAALHALHSRTIKGIGIGATPTEPSAPPPAATPAATAEPEATADPATTDAAPKTTPNPDGVTYAELEHLNLPLPGALARARERAEGLRLLATLVVLAAVGYFGWQHLKTDPAPAEPHIVVPQGESVRPEAVAAPQAQQPAMPNAQFGRVLPFIDPSHKVPVAADQGLLVVEYKGSEPAPSVHVGGQDLGKPPIAVALTPGRHELVLRSGKSTSFRYLIVRPGETRIVSLPLADL